MSECTHNEPLNCFHCDTPGLVMDDLVLTEVNNSMGQHYWKAKQPIGYIFGSEVDGEIEAFGATKEKCLENLAKERRKLHDSLWA